MTISNAIPVQFWINGVETYNETTICGVEPVCFCQPFNCDDEIRIQFQDSNALTYNLQVLDADGNELQSIPFDDVASGVWQINFIPLNYGVCDEKIQLKIQTDAPTIGALSTFTNIGSGTNWTTGANPSFNITGAFARTKNISGSFYGVSGVTYHFNYNIDLTVGSDLQDVYICLLNASGGIITSAGINQFGTGNYSGLVSLTPNQATYYVGIYAILEDSGIGSVQGDINSFSLVTTSDYIHAKSDCIDVKTDHDCTTLIEYLNTDDFNNIVYLTSPTIEFKIRVPAQFWKEDNPMEQEDSELSNGVIKTRRQSIQEKRLLEVGFMPNYMHKKLQLVLMHDTITIDGDQWKRRDAYESEPIRRYPLKKANVWLTKYNSIEDNII